MKNLFLEDLKDFSEKKIKKHLATEYRAEQYYPLSLNEEDKKIMETLKDYFVLIAYESVGSWGCDSSSFFLLKDNKDNYFEIHGGHCSCYGFEGQFQLEPTDLKSLEFFAKNKEFYGGGYDDNIKENAEKIKRFILDMCEGK